MSSVLDEIESFVADLAIQGGEALAVWAWHRVTGASTADDEDKIKAIATHAAEVSAAAAIAKARELAELAEVEIVQGVDDLLAKAEDVLAAFLPPALPSVPKLGVDISFDTSEAETPPDGTKP